MNSKDSIRDGFNELLKGINKELETRHQEKSSSQSAALKNQPQPEKAQASEKNPDSDSGGTRVFDAVKADASASAEAEQKAPLSSSAPKEAKKVPVNRTRSTMAARNTATQNQAKKSGAKPIARNASSNTTQFSTIKNSKGLKPSNQRHTEQENTVPQNKSKKNGTKKKSVIWNGLIKLVLYISLIAVVSGLLAYYIISVGNDMFSFVKDTYTFSDTVYLIKGESDNTLQITDTKLSGNKFTFEYQFKRALTEKETESLTASVILIDTKDNSVAYNYGKFGDMILEGKAITLDLAESKMQDGDYILRFTVSTSQEVSFITEFTVSKKIVDISIPADATTSDVAKLLEKNGIIDHPFAFKVYTDYKKGKSTYYGKGYIPGEHSLYSGMDYDTLISVLSPKTSTRTIVRLTFPEGSTVDEIIDILIKGGIQNTREEYTEVINNYDFDYEFVKLLDNQELHKERKYRLEGYLFPDTYEFYSDASPAAVIDKFLSNFNNKFDHSYYDEATKLGLTVDEIITLASIVEKEAKMPDDFGLVSSVFHNRLNKPSEYPYLQSDATVQYIFPERKGKITPEDLEIVSAYNTYKSKGLPPSAIANPGLEAITWALYPAEPRTLDSAGNPTGSRIYYYYFVARSDGSNLYARNLSEHQANIEKVRRETAN